MIFRYKHEELDDNISKNAFSLKRNKQKKQFSQQPIN